jgi:hypothetical protein
MIVGLSTEVIAAITKSGKQFLEGAWKRGRGGGLQKWRPEGCKEKQYNKNNYINNNLIEYK